MARPITQDSDASQYAGILGRLERLEQSVSQQPLWYDVVFQANWASLANYPLQVARIRPGVGIFRGIANRVTTAFSFPSNVFALPSGFQFYAGATNIITAVWGQDSTSTKNMYRVVMTRSSGVVSIDQVLTGIAANGGVGTFVVFEGLTFSLLET